MPRMTQHKVNPQRLDANEQTFFERQLRYVKSRTYDTLYKELKAMMLIPVSTEAMAGADTIAYYQYTNIGTAKIIADYATDFPRVDTYGEEREAKIKSLGSSYGYSLKEIRRAMMAGLNLTQRKANAARRSIDQLVNNLALLGDADAGIQGLLTYPGITEVTIPDGANGTKTWKTKTPDEILLDISNMQEAIVDTTNGVEQPNTLLLPLEQFTYIANTRMTGDSARTIMRYILENSPWISRIEWLVELNGIGDGNTNRILLYDNSPDKLTLEMPQPFEQFDAQMKGMEYEIPCHAETAGTIVYYPLSVAYGDGV